MEYFVRLVFPLEYEAGVEVIKWNQDMRHFRGQCPNVQKRGLSLIRVPALWKIKRSIENPQTQGASQRAFWMFFFSSQVDASFWSQISFCFQIRWFSERFIKKTLRFPIYPLFWTLLRKPIIIYTPGLFRGLVLILKGPFFGLDHSKSSSSGVRLVIYPSRHTYGYLWIIDPQNGWLNSKNDGPKLWSPRSFVRKNGHTGHTVVGVVGKLPQLAKSGFNFRNIRYTPLGNTRFRPSHHTYTCQQSGKRGTVDGSEILYQLRLVVYPIIYKGFIHFWGGGEWDFWSINSSEASFFQVEGSFCDCVTWPYEWSHETVNPSVFFFEGEGVGKPRGWEMAVFFLRKNDVFFLAFGVAKML